MKADKEFDAVKFMRQRREEISKEFAEMTYEEKRKYLDEHVKFRSDRKPDRASKKVG